MERTFWIGTHPMLCEKRITYMLEQLEAAGRACTDKKRLECL
jgi:hypothetical protein